MILGVVSMRYPDFKCRAIQSEAKFSLQEIYAAQMRYHAENNEFATLSKLIDEDGRVILPKKYYKFVDEVLPTKDSFLVYARGIDGTLVSGEVWSVNQSEDIRIIRLVCKN
jgi:hypothetical protein